MITYTNIATIKEVDEWVAGGLTSDFPIDPNKLLVHWKKIGALDEYTKNTDGSMRVMPFGGDLISFPISSEALKNAAVSIHTDLARRGINSAYAFVCFVELLSDFVQFACVSPDDNKLRDYYIELYGDGSEFIFWTDKIKYMCLQSAEALAVAIRLCAGCTSEPEVSDKLKALLRPVFGKRLNELKLAAGNAVREVL